MFVKLDRDVIDILCCPLCKSSIEFQNSEFLCRNCLTLYPRITINQKNGREYVFDFRIERPDYCIPPGWAKWHIMQNIYEDVQDSTSCVDNLNFYLQEINGVRDIYTKQFEIKGTVLDVGGHQGRLRHFLKESVSMYVSIDPFPDVFRDVDSQKNLLKAYPCILEACNFLAGFAENLPFVEKSFDWVHMRSVLDHFYDPLVAIKEAYRVLKPGGRILVGLSVKGEKDLPNGNVKSGLGFRPYVLLSRFVNKLKREGAKGFKKAVASRVKTFGRDHIWHWSYENLLDLFDKTNFVIEKEYWQNSDPVAPICIYVSARKT